MLEEGGAHQPALHLRAPPLLPPGGVGGLSTCQGPAALTASSSSSLGREKFGLGCTSRCSGCFHALAALARGIKSYLAVVALFPLCGVPGWDLRGTCPGHPSRDGCTWPSLSTFYFNDHWFFLIIYLQFSRDKNEIRVIFYTYKAQKEKTKGFWGEGHGGDMLGRGRQKKNERKGEEREKFGNDPPAFMGQEQLSSSTYSISARGLLPRKGHAEKLSE